MGEEKLIGSYKAALDKGGRLKIPERFRAIIQERYGSQLFITSLDDEAVRVFPLPVWEEMTGTSDKGLAYIRPTYRNFFLRAHRMGGVGEIDAKGRVLLNPRLREKMGLKDDVEVVGMNNHLEVWDPERLDAKLDQKPLTYDDLEKFAALASDRKSE